MLKSHFDIYYILYNNVKRLEEITKRIAKIGPAFNANGLRIFSNTDILNKSREGRRMLSFYKDLLFIG
jgi:hypothetical protein